MYVVDASVWVSRLVPLDPYHILSTHWLYQRITRGELLVAPSLVLAEVAGAVVRRTGKASLGVRALALLTRLPTVRLVPVEAELAMLGGRLAADLSLRGADALYVAVAHRLGVPLITWDREQRERGCQVIPVLTHPPP